MAPIFNKLTEGENDQQRATRDDAGASKKEGGLDIRWDMASPQGKVVCFHGSQLAVQSRDMIDQAEILTRVQVRHGSWVDAQRRKGEHAGGLPVGNVRFNLRRPHEVGLVRCGGAISIGGLHVVVRAADLVLGAIAAVSRRLVYLPESVVSLLTNH